VVEGGRYRGALEVRVTPEGTSMEVINILPMEDYLRGVVGKEVSFYWPFEVLKTQAIVARTYSYDRQIKKKFLLYDLKGTVDSQVYGGVSAETGLIDRAVKETENQVLKYQGRIFPTFYHSSCGGETEASHNIWAIELKPLNGRVCIYCKYSPFQKWKVRYTDQQVSRALKNFPRAQSSKVKEIRVKSRSGSKRVTWMEIVYANKQSIKMSGNTFRLKVGADQLRSTIFDVKKRGSYFYFEGRGWGHGIGLCQWGSKGMVDQKGMTAEEILLHYYPGSELLHV
jgi:stage II sporulation protein D